MDRFRTKDLLFDGNASFDTEDAKRQAQLDGLLEKRYYNLHDMLNMSMQSLEWLENNNFVLLGNADLIKFEMETTENMRLNCDRDTSYEFMHGYKNPCLNINPVLLVQRLRGGGGNEGSVLDNSKLEINNYIKSAYSNNTLAKAIMDKLIDDLIKTDEVTYREILINTNVNLLDSGNGYNFIEPVNFGYWINKNAKYNTNCNDAVVAYMPSKNTKEKGLASIVRRLKNMVKKNASAKSTVSEEDTAEDAKNTIIRLRSAEESVNKILLNGRTTINTAWCNYITSLQALIAINYEAIEECYNECTYYKSLMLLEHTINETQKIKLMIPTFTEEVINPPEDYERSPQLSEAFGKVAAQIVNNNTGVDIADIAQIIAVKWNNRDWFVLRQHLKRKIYVYLSAVPDNIKNKYKEQRQLLEYIEQLALSPSTNAIPAYFKVIIRCYNNTNKVILFQHIDNIIQPLCEIDNVSLRLMEYNDTNVVAGLVMKGIDKCEIHRGRRTNDFIQPKLVKVRKNINELPAVFKEAINVITNNITNEDGTATYACSNYIKGQPCYDSESWRTLWNFDPSLSGGCSMIVDFVTAVTMLYSNKSKIQNFTMDINIEHSQFVDIGLYGVRRENLTIATCSKNIEFFQHYIMMPVSVSIIMSDYNCMKDRVLLIG